MAFSDKDKVVIKFARQNNNYGAKMFLKISGQRLDIRRTKFRRKYTRQRSEILKNSASELLMLGMNVINGSSMRLLISGVFVFKLVLRTMADIFNTYYTSMIFQN